MGNWIPTSNPFGLATPPEWFLKAMHAYDPLLVIFASTSNPVYRLARRTSTGRAMLNNILKSYPDSSVYFENKLWAWKSVEPMGIGGNHHGMTWQKLLLEIPEYDLQRAGGGDAAADALDSLEEKQEASIDRGIQSELDARNHDAYILAAAMNGNRTRAPRAGRKSQPVYRPPAFGGGSAIFVGR